MVDWNQELAQMHAAKQRVWNADAEGLWRREEPRSPVSRAKLAEVRARLGFELDAQYQEFLLHADGWPALFQQIDLFGTNELLGPELDSANELVSYVESDTAVAAGLDRGNNLTIAMSATSIDAFVMPLSRGHGPALVIWLVGGEIERHDSFVDFFRRMRALNEKEAADLYAGR